MLFMQDELVNVLQQDRRIEVDNARENALVSVPDTSNLRLVVVFSAMIDRITRPQTPTEAAAPTNAA